MVALASVETVLWPMSVATCWRMLLPDAAAVTALPEYEQATMLWRWEYCARFKILEGIAELVYVKRR